MRSWRPPTGRCWPMAADQGCNECNAYKSGETWYSCKPLPCRPAWYGRMIRFHKVIGRSCPGVFRGFSGGFRLRECRTHKKGTHGTLSAVSGNAEHRDILGYGKALAAAALLGVCHPSPTSPRRATVAPGRPQTGGACADKGPPTSWSSWPSFLDPLVVREMLGSPGVSRTLPGGLTYYILRVSIGKKNPETHTL